MGQFMFPGLGFLDENGDPYSGGTLDFFATGSATPKNTYSDSALTTPNPNPVTLNGRGAPTTDIYFESGQYKIVLKDSGGTEVRSVDPWPPAAASSEVPTGGIILWSGAIAQIPSGWALCDGSNSTPDLTDRFVIGAGNTHAVDDTGGTSTPTTAISGAHKHTGNTGAHALTVGQIPAHTHPFFAPQFSGSKTIDTDPGGNQSTGETNNTGSAGSGQSHRHTISSDGGHTHTISDLQPFYALAYIMKT